MKRKLHTSKDAVILLYLAVLLLANISCQQKNVGADISSPPSGLNIIVPDSTHTIKASRTTTLQFPDSNKIDFRRWKTKLSAELLSESRPKTINLKHTKTVIDSTKIHIRSLPDSVTRHLKIPINGFLVSHSDTIYAAERVLAEIPEAVPIKLATKLNAEKNIQFMDIETELTAQYITQTLFDSRGYVWLTSYGGGLIRYDGNTIRTFTELEGLSTSFINFVFEDSQNNLWMGTDGFGLMKYDGNSFYYYNEKQGFTVGQRDVNSGMEDKFGNLWFGTDDGLLQFLPKTDKEPHQKIIFRTNFSDENEDVITRVIQGKDDAIWLGTSTGIYEHTKSATTHFDISTNYIRDLHKDSQGNLWIAYESEGFVKFNGHTLEQFVDPENPLHNKIQSIYEGADKKIYIGTENRGLLIYDGEQFEELNEDVGLASKWIMDINEDVKGNFWISTWFDGIFKYGTLQLEHLPRKTSNISSTIFSIEEDTEGTIWLGGVDNGIYSIKGNNKYHIDLNKSELQNNISAMAIEQNNALWTVGTSNNTVSRVFEGEATNYELISKKKIMLIDVVFDSKGMLWISDFNNGIIRYDGKDFHRLTQKEGLLDDYVYQIIEHPNGDIYFLSFEGVTILSNNSLKSFRLGEYYISCSLADSSNHIWFGTNEGPIRLENGDNNDELRYRKYASKKHPSNNFVNTINESANGELWIGTDTKGMIVFRPTEETNTSGEYRYEHINREDGFIGTGVLFSSGFIDSNQKLWLGTKKGITKIDLKQNVVSKDSLQLHLTDISVNTIPIKQYFTDLGRTVDSTSAQQTKRTLTPFFNIPETLELDYTGSHLTFTFGALEWKAPHAINYQFKLSGLDANWSEITEVNTADYRNLSYGNYSFMVRAISKSGVWSDTISYDFEILPPWWHTWWARILYGIGVLLLVGSALKYRISVLQSRIEATYRQQLISQEALEEGRQMEKERIARELHDGVLGSLFGIRLGLDAFKDDIPGLSKQAGTYVEKLSTLESDIRRLSHGLSYSDVFSDNPFVKVVEELVIEQGTLYPIEFDYKNENIPWNKISDNVKYNLYRIIQETLRNIVKHAKATKVEICFIKEGDTVILKITDNGIGLKPKKKQKGIGFKNIDARAKAIQGQVIFENQKKGLLVQVSFPIDVKI